ncbi:Ubiquitin-conjugating enzyme, partial [Globisporangium splendens]
MAASVRNTAIKRIQGDVREMMTNPSDQYVAAPLESNMFDWHFTLRGPRDTEFEGGIYHGRILLPSDYPFKPPNIMLLTPNGRFEVRKKICLSISAHHPEEWQPAWGVRLILEALISFMPTKGEGAIGALDFPPEERKRLAQQSVTYKCDTCGCIADLLPELQQHDDASEEQEKKPSKYAAQIAQLHLHSLEADTANSAAKETEKEPPAEKREDVDLPPAATATTTSPRESTAVTAPAEASPPSPVAAEAPVPVVDVTTATNVASHAATSSREPSSVDTLLHYFAIACLVALFALLYKKLLKMQGVLP